jgi:alcohol dehydrogenase class IV
VAVPTTYSGTEASGCFYVSERQEKRREAGPGVRPDMVISDPGLTLTLPWKATGGTGMTALAHCMEALCSRTRTSLSDSVATSAARSIVQVLPVVTASPKRVREREEMLGAAFAAGVASDVAGRGLHHALCTGLGGRTGVAHGVASAILLPLVLRSSPKRPNEGPALFARAIGRDDPAQAADALADLIAQLRLPRKLREVGVFEQDLEAVASWVGERSHEARNDPDAFSVDDALAILRTAW